MNPAGMFNTTATLSERTPVQGSNGSVSYTSTTTDFSCAVNPMGPKEVLAHGRPEGTIMARLYCGPTVQFQVKDTVTWSGGTWRVVGPAINTGGRGVFQTVILEKAV